MKKRLVLDPIKFSCLPYENIIAEYLDVRAIVYSRQGYITGDIRVDFVLVGLDIIIEVDDPSHGRTVKRNKDRDRDRYLSSSGFTVVRVTNKEASNGSALIIINEAILEARGKLPW